MGSSDRKSRRTALIGAAGFFVFGAVLLLVAHSADLHNTIIPRGGAKTAWMYPWQGYAAALVCFAASSYSLFLAFRKDERDDEFVS